MTAWNCGSFQLDLSSRPLIMGILNATPDSFSDGYPCQEYAISQAEQLVRDGADIIDVGGESTRPGSKGVSADEEIERIIPVIERLAQNCDVPISVDTQKVEVARRAISAGASIINHVSATLDFEDMLPLLQDSNVGYVIMHMAARPDVMQDHPEYDDVVNDLIEKLRTVMQSCEQRGINRERLLPDPGIGFGKTLQHNLDIFLGMNQMSSQLGRPILMGLSRKTWFTNLLGTERGKIAELDAHTAHASCILPFPSVAVHRVHNVKMLRHALTLRSSLGIRHG